MQCSNWCRTMSKLEETKLLLVLHSQSWYGQFTKPLLSFDTDCHMQPNTHLFNGNFPGKSWSSPWWWQMTGAKRLCGWMAFLTPTPEISHWGLILSSVPLYPPTSRCCWNTVSLLLLLLLSPVGVQSLVISMSICLSVCLLTHLKNHMSKLHKIFCTS